MCNCTVKYSITKIIATVRLQSQRRVEVATLKDEIVKLKSQIVESPEELRNEMERMKENVKNIKMSKVCDSTVIHLLCYIQYITRWVSDWSPVMDWLMCLVTGSGRREAGGASDAGAVCRSGGGRDSGFTQTAAGPAEQHGSNQPAEGEGMQFIT